MHSREAPAAASQRGVQGAGSGCVRRAWRIGGGRGTLVRAERQPGAPVATRPQGRSGEAGGAACAECAGVRRAVAAGTTPAAARGCGAEPVWGYARGAFDAVPGVIYDFCVGRGAQFPRAFLGDGAYYDNGETVDEVNGP